MARQLPKRTHASITQLCAEGDQLFESGQAAAALEKYREAWALIPDDKIQWEASTWVLSAAGEVYFQTNDYATSLNRFERAIQGPGGLGNPYIHLRLGELYYEMGNRDASADELARAYMGAGSGIFEKEDPKYFAFLKTRLNPPPDGW
jgi:tetratricopeptide (TPR) repeat protein